MGRVTSRCVAHVYVDVFVCRVEQKTKISPEITLKTDQTTSLSRTNDFGVCDGFRIDRKSHMQFGCDFERLPHRTNCIAPLLYILLYTYI